MTTNGTRYDVYQKITDQIIAAIEKGAGDFEMPWHRDVSRSLPTNAFSDQPYNGVNILALWAAAELSDFKTGLWATHKQWTLLNARVRKGEKGTVAVFYKKMQREVASEDTGERELRTYGFARAFHVFNVDQVDGWKSLEPPVVSDPAEVIEGAEQFVCGTGADIRRGGDRAFYSPSKDFIQIPDRERFSGTKESSATESYYSTLLHELTHWTGHERRLKRDLSARFGDGAYAMEELVAEFGAAFLCGHLGVTNVPRVDHAQYIAHWLKVLKKDKRAIFTASSKASEAKGFLTELQRAA